MVALIDGALIVHRMARPRLRAWTVYMPDVEQSQKFNPYNLLFSPEGWDKRIPVSSVIDPFSPTKPSMFRSLLGCHPSAIVFEQSNGMPQMPIRYYLYGNDARVATCARHALPLGYRLDEGERPPVENGS